MLEEQEPVDPLCRSPASLVEAEVVAAGRPAAPGHDRQHPSWLHSDGESFRS